jgi:hypothetical protein
MVKDMDRLAMQEEAGEAIEVDPFSDPDEGQELIITRQKAVDKQGKETGKWEHIVSMGMPSKKETWPDYFERTRVTDEQLEQLSKLEPLSKIQGNEVYTKRDFELAMDGLRRFDEKHKYQIFDNDEFLQELSEIEALVPEKRDEDIKEMFSDENAAKLADKKKSTDVDETADDDNGIGDDKPTPSEMKIALKRYIRKEFGETYVEQIPTNQKKLEQWYALYEDGDELPIALKQGTSSNESQKTDDAAVDTREATEEVSPDIAKLRARRRSAQN